MDEAFHELALTVGFREACMLQESVSSCAIEGNPTTLKDILGKFKSGEWYYDGSGIRIKDVK